MIPVSKGASPAPASISPPAAPKPELRIDSPLFQLNRAVSSAYRLNDAIPERPAPVISEGLELRRDQLRLFEILHRDCGEAVLHQFRQLRGRLLRRAATLLDPGDRAISILVTSPDPCTGKSFIARNLALMTCAVPDARVLLADANPANPSLTSLFGQSLSAGLRQFAAGTPWHESACRVPGLDMWTAALGQELPDALEPLNVGLVRRWLKTTDSGLNWIFLDGPALSQSPEAEALAHTVDLTLLVLSPGQASYRSLVQALTRLDRTRLAGCILNHRP